MELKDKINTEGRKFMNFEKIEIKREEEKKPEKLFRAFTVNPEELSLEKLKEDLVPGNVNENDPTKISDGNELGVYMSTNPLMVEKSYSYGTGNYEDLHLRVLKHSVRGGGYAEFIKLPACGIVYEIDTKDLDIRKPEIRSELQGVYNNQFEGDEWIANRVPAKNCRVKKLILSEYANDRNWTEINVTGLDDKKIQEAIDLIKEKFRKSKSEAIKFKDFLESLSEKERFVSYMPLRVKYEKYLDEKR